MKRGALAILAVPVVLTGIVSLGASAPDAGYSQQLAAATSRADRLAGQLAKERAADRAEDARFRRAIRASHSRPEFVWWNTGDPDKVAEAVFDEQGTPQSERRRWRCIFNRETAGTSFHDIWYSGDKPGGGYYRGWRPEFAGTDRVNGYAQLRPYHAETGDLVVTYATYLRTSDPVFAVRKSLRLGFGPFFASTPPC